MISSNSTTTLVMQGWTKGPSGRGTYDIIWSCFTTIFLALYTMLHVNVKSPEEGHLHVVLRKTRWLILAILAPELLMLLAGGQWASAKRSVEDMKEALGVENLWALKHAFYADSGGLVIEVIEDDDIDTKEVIVSPQINRRRTFPITAKQIHYLVKNENFELPRITKEEIWDKSKADTMAKGLMCFQTAWFVINCTTRLVEKLPVTPLELSTAALVSCSAATYFFWWHKPLNVEFPTIIATMQRSTLRNIQRRAAAAAAEINHISTTYAKWYDCEVSPLEFAEPDAFISRSWHPHLSEIIVKLGFQQRTMTRLPNDRDPRLHSLKLHLVCALFTALFTSLHFIDWKFAFPTKIELLCYRATCCAMEVVMFLYGSVEVIGCYVEDFEHTGLNTMGGYKKRWPACLMFIVPAAVYFAARLILLAVVLSCLRSMPAGSYADADWGWLDFVPHL